MTATPKAFVTGNPIHHSKSPILHSYWLKKYNISGTYSAIKSDDDSLPTLIEQVRAGQWRGGNITIPHKQFAFDLCDHHTETAKKTGAVNTIWAEKGKIFGDNTDGYGFVANLDHQLPNWDQQKQCAIVLGAGGAARAILAALVDKGFKTIYLLNRTRARADRLAEEFGGPIVPQTLDHFNEISARADLVVNTSAVGMHGSKFDQLDVNILPITAIVADIVYTPLFTPLLKEAKNRGLNIATGLGMLVHQAVPGFEIWFGCRPEVDQTLMDKMLGETQHG